MNGLQRAARVVNAVTTPLVRLPLLRPLLGRSMTVLTYTGRRSGRELQLPVAYRRKADELTVPVALPDQKNWWRNFVGEGAPVSLELNGQTRTGHGRSARDSEGAVTVRIVLDHV
ncbi:nitroreductase/quinone reductase family protein [Ornithinimicrobium faecis]|uniref:nitroreductase/quinone reductase family protein n=1 Tax=Ornithinimicrobium faecis TaxID=2934158 RepID=UPI00211775A6|nr:nitroreductase/quinone reductase family protein [Ornithinimicrobium sp. HY1745]